MVKIGALIGASFVTIGAIFQIVFSIFVVSGIGEWQGFQAAASIVDGGANFQAVFSTIMYYLGIIIVLGSGFIKGKLFLKIGGGVMILGVLPVMIAWLFGQLYEPLYYSGNAFMFLGVILYFIGCIQFRKHNIVTIFTGFLLVVSVIVSQIVFGTFFMIISDRALNVVAIHFGTLIIQIILFILHSWIFGFSKKRVEYSDKVEDILSIEKGQAFASYVPDNMKKKKKKGKKSSESDEITFTF